MRPAFLATLLLAPLLAPLLASQTAAAQTWLAETTHTLPGGETGWGAVTVEPAAPGHPPRLFIARHDDGLLAWDPSAATGTTIVDSKGANAVIFAPPAGRAYAPMADGTVLAIDIKTRQPLGRTDAGQGELRTGLFEPTQNRIHLITAPIPENQPEKAGDKTTWVTLDAASGQVLGHTEFNSRIMDTPVTDGKGAIFAPMRDKGLLQRLDAKDLTLQKTWKLGDCQQPAAVLWDEAAQRVLLACRGDKPVFVALNPATGIVATIPIGRGADSLVMDDTRHLLVTSNGQDGTLSVIRQDTPDTYALVETIGTRPMTPPFAQGLARDPSTGRIFTATATITQPAPAADGKSPTPIIHPGSFAIGTYRPHPP